MKRFIFLIGAVLFYRKKRIPPHDPRTVAIVKIGAIGDVLMSTPLLEQIRQRYPLARIVYIVGDWSKGVLQNNPYIDKVISFNDTIVWRFQLIGIWGLFRRIREESIDLCFVLDRHYFAPILAFFGGARFRVGFDRKGEGFANNISVAYGPVRHEVDYNLDLLKALGWQTNIIPMCVYPGQTEQSFARHLLARHSFLGKQIFGVAPGGAKNPGQEMLIRRWPFWHYRTLVRLLLQQSPESRIIIFGGPNDKETNKNVLHGIDDNRILDCTGQTSILQSAALMQHCAVLIAHDSGPMHLAAAAGVPVISLFGPVHPDRKAPRGRFDRYIWRSDLPGALCDEEGVFPHTVSTLECMEKILPTEVIAVVQQVLYAKEKKPNVE